MIDIKLLREICAKFGGHLFACDGKVPINKGWRNNDDINDTHPEKYKSIGFAIDDPTTVIVDVDMYRSDCPETLDAFWHHLESNIISPRRQFIVSTARCGSHMYFKCPALPKLELKRKSDVFNFVDLQTVGRYVIAPGSETADGRYQLQTDVVVAELDPKFFTPWLCNLPSTANHSTASKSKPEITPEQLHDLLSGIRVEDYKSYHDWIRILFAAKHATGGSQEALRVFTRWSAQDPNHNNSDNAAKIRKFWHEANREDSACTVGTLIHAYDQYNLSRPAWFDQKTNNFISAKDKEIKTVDGIEFETDKNGHPRVNAYNLDLIFSKHEEFKGKYKYNTFSNQIENDNGEYVDFDAELVNVRQKLYSIYPWANNISLNKLQEAITLSAHENKFHALQDKLNSFEWDGTCRVEKFFSVYCATPDDEYHKQVSRLLFTAGVKRAFNPGCKYDHVIILVGGQGLGKSTLIDILSCGYFSSLATDSHQRAVEEIQGAWLVEINELVSMRKREIDDFKQFVSTRIDTTRLAYARSVKKFPRTCIFLGTTNNEEFLRDETGHRRFIPVDVGLIDLKAVYRDREQLWAEALHIYKQNPKVILTLPESLDAELAEMHAQHEERDEWESELLSVLSSPDSRAGLMLKHSGCFKLLDLWSDLKSFSSFDTSITELSYQHSRRLGKILRQLGYKRKTRRMDNRVEKLWCKP